MKQVYQYRYYGDNNSKNFPKGITYNTITSGTAFSGHLPIIQLGIQAMPGTKFSLNHSSDKVIIGTTGIYELDLTGQAEITSLMFDYESIAKINSSANSGNMYLLVDVVYDNKEDN